MFPGHDPVSRRLAAIGHEFNHGLALDLERILNALAALGDPHRKLPPVFHVAGTNGKGSTCAFLRAMIEAAGLKAHVFTSPHLIVPNERVRLAGRLVQDEPLLNAIDRVQATGVTLSYFEVMTAAAFLLFAETPADALVLEVGLGGRLDATNVIARPVAAVITPVDLDHMAILGPTVARIAAEKAGIIKSQAPVIVARQAPDAMAVIEAEALARGARLSRCGVEWDCWAAHGRLVVQTHDRLLDLPAPALSGPHQFANAGLAAAAILHWRDFSDEQIGRGVETASWPARMQRLKNGPLAARVTARGGELWLDGGHNPHGARAIAATLEEMKRRAPRPVILICGMLATKDVEGFLAPLAHVAEAVIAVPFSADAARRPEEITGAARKAGLRSEQAASLEDALERAFALAEAPPRILICGSLHLAGEVLACSGGVI